MAQPEHPTHQVVHDAQPGDGVDVGVDRTRQARNGRSSRHVLWILGVSVVLALVAMFGYWASISDDLHRADKTGGATIASGQTTTDPATVAQFQAPEPAPKQPPEDSIAASSGASATNVPVSPNQPIPPGG